MSTKNPGSACRQPTWPRLRLVGAGRAGGLRDGSAVFDVEAGAAGVWETLP